MNSLSQQYLTYIQELELNPELVLNKHFRFPNEAFTGKQVPQTRFVRM